MRNYSFFFVGHSTKAESGNGNGNGNGDILFNKKGEGKVEVEKRDKGSGVAPRFALELDGLHCFETLVAH
ncbi:hypothetical protein J5N97_019122 [Dioscorea zingiberensis]|uniref:Uncharacterized protein n=1 Tax=Dioscorea zingiberensis TaxID=325984 RepID=A0A9D5HCK4_9LILI|nr:hypothetical protein J5N97_019122 [Dioscorea zingiberensis]